MVTLGRARAYAGLPVWPYPATLDNGTARLLAMRRRAVAGVSVLLADHAASLLDIHRIAL
jgi:hypothetical protein